MATANPVPVVRDVSNSSHHFRGVNLVAGRVTGGGTHTVTVETKLQSIVSVLVVKTNATVAVIAATIADSTTYVGTKTVAFAVANAGEYSYMIVGLLDIAATVDTISANTTITHEPING